MTARSDTMPREATAFVRRVWTPDARPMQPTSDGRYLVTVGAARLETAVFATTFVGSLARAQDEASRIAGTRPVWLRDVIGGEVHHRASGGYWQVGEGEA